MGISLVASTKVMENDGSGTTPSIDTTGANLLVAIVTSGIAFTSITDSKGNTWSLVGTYGSSYSELRLYKVENPTVGSGHTFTLTSNYSSLCVGAFSGVKTSSPADGVNGSTTSGTTIQAGSVTPSQNGDLFIAGIVADAGVATNSINSGFTIAQENDGAGGNVKNALAYKIQTGSAAAENPQWTHGASSTLSAVLAAFKADVPTITTTTLPNGVIDTAYSQTLGVTGGTGSITWSVVSGALPDGLSLNSSTGEISGTPTTIGAFSFTVRATDSAAAYDEQALSITIVATPPILGTDGNEYHKFAVPCSVKEYDEDIGFSVLRNQLSDGYRRRTLYGSNTGLRGFKLTMPTLAGSSGSGLVTGISGEEVTKEEYLWSLYCECESTGVPFVIESQRNNQYYLVEFVNERLSYSRFLTKLYSTGVDLIQVRIDGVSIFQPSRVNGLFGYWDADTDFVSDIWAGTDGATGTPDLEKAGDVIDVAAAVNGHQIKRFNNSANTGHVSGNLPSGVVYDLIIAMKMREGSFSNDCGIFVDIANGIDFILGDSGTTKFQTSGFSTDNFSYFLNGQEYAINNLQAPMNTWGICHFRNLDGWNVPDGLFLMTSTASARAEADVGDIVMLSKPSLQTCREITEQMMVKWL